MRFSIRQLKFALLECFAAEARAHRGNVLGRPHQWGSLERRLGVTFTPEERTAAYQALRQLEGDGLVTPTHADLAAPFDWLELTAAGRRAAERHALDELDQSRCKKLILR
jgi:hypothetical protein